MCLLLFYYVLVVYGSVVYRPAINSRLRSPFSGVTNADIVGCVALLCLTNLFFYRNDIDGGTRVRTILSRWIVQIATSTISSVSTKMGLSRRDESI